MSRLSDLAFRIRALLRRGGMEHELDDELRFHLEMDARQLVDQGRTPEAAADEARRRFGVVGRETQRARDSWGIAAVLDALGDLRVALRQLRRRPLYTLLGVGTLALGIGATVALSSVVLGLLVRPMPVADDARLQVFWSDFNWRGVEFDYVKERQQAFSGLAAYSLEGYTLAVNDQSATVVATVGSAELFDVLGATPLLGRTFRAGEDRPGAAPIAVVSHGFWQQELGGDPAVIGRRIEIDGAPGGGGRRHAARVLLPVAAGTDLASADARPRDRPLPGQRLAGARRPRTPRAQPRRARRRRPGHRAGARRAVRVPRGLGQDARGARHVVARLHDGGGAARRVAAADGRAAGARHRLRERRGAGPRPHHRPRRGTGAARRARRRPRPSDASDRHRVGGHVGAGRGAGRARRRRRLRRAGRPPAARRRAGRHPDRGLDAVRVGNRTVDCRRCGRGAGAGAGVDRRGIADARQGALDRRRGRVGAPSRPRCAGRRRGGPGRAAGRRRGDVHALGAASLRHRHRVRRRQRRRHRRRGADPGHAASRPRRVPPTTGRPRRRPPRGAGRRPDHSPAAARQRLARHHDHRGSARPGR